MMRAGLISDSDNQPGQSEQGQMGEFTGAAVVRPPSYSEVAELCDFEEIAGHKVPFAQRVIPFL